MEKVAQKINIPKIDKAKFKQIFDDIASIKLSKKQVRERVDLLEESSTKAEDD